MKPIVVDTNVPVCAGGGSPHASQACVRACIDQIDVLTNRGLLVIDDGWVILSEYERNLSPMSQQGLGYAFYKWVFTNKSNRNRVRQVQLTIVGTDGDYAEFPQDPDLAGFDRNDRKFAAVAIAAGPRRRPDIVNATDTDWKKFEAVLRGHGIRIQFLCPELMG